MLPYASIVICAPKLGKVEATNKELEERLRQAVAEMEALKNQLKQGEVY